MHRSRRVSWSAYQSRVPLCHPESGIASYFYISPPILFNGENSTFWSYRIYITENTKQPNAYLVYGLHPGEHQQTCVQPSKPLSIEVEPGRRASDMEAIRRMGYSYLADRDVYYEWLLRMELHSDSRGERRVLDTYREDLDLIDRIAELPKASFR